MHSQLIKKYCSKTIFSVEQFCLCSYESGGSRLDTIEFRTDSHLSSSLKRNLYHPNIFFYWVIEKVMQLG